MGRLTNLRPMVGTLPARVAMAPKIADTFYSTAEWRELARKVKRERGNACIRCGSRNRVIADHIIERKDGGAELDERNIQLLCHQHHQEKTAAARKQRARS